MLCCSQVRWPPTYFLFCIDVFLLRHLGFSFQIPSHGHIPIPCISFIFYCANTLYLDDSPVCLHSTLRFSARQRDAVLQRFSPNSLHIFGFRLS